MPKKKNKPEKKNTPEKKKMPKKKNKPEKKNTPEKKTVEKTVSCHQCHRHHPESEVIPCSKGCDLKYGLGCLYKNYAGEIVPEESISTWECPRCRKDCNCNYCVKIFPNQKALQKLALEMEEMKKKEEEAQATILLLQAKLADVESQKLALEKKERDKRIIANMLDALSKCLQIFGPLLDENQKRSILDEIKQVISASASRKGDQAEKTNTEEEKQVFYQVVEVLGSLIKILKASFLPCIDELSSHLMPMLAKDSTTGERRQAISIFGDVADVCLEAEYHSVFAFWFRYYDTYLPSLLEACNDESSDIRQAAACGVGICAEHGGSVIKPLIGEALSRLTAVISDPNALDPDNVMAHDNAVSAVGKLLHFHHDSIDSAQKVIPVWLNCLPIKVDVIEAKALHELLTLMVERSDAQLLGPNNENLPKVFSIFAEILGAGKDLASDQTICRISNLLRQFQKTLPPASLASILIALQPQQQLVLQSILSS